MKHLAPLIAVLLFCAVACQAATGAGVPQATDAPRMAQNTPEAATVAQEPRRSPTADAAAILAIMQLNATQTEKAEQRHWLNETSTMQALNNQYTREAQTQAAPQATAREKALSTQNAMIAANMTQSADNRTATYTAPRDEATAAVLRENIRYAPLTALFLPISWLITSVSGAALVFLLFYAIFAPRRDSPLGEEKREGPRVVFVEENTMRPIPTPPGEYSQFLMWARAAIVNSYVSYRAMVGAGKPFATNEAYKPLWEWARDHGISEEKDGRNVLSTRGRDYCGAALRDVDPPALDANNAENMPPAGNARDYNARNSSGGVIADPFGVLPKEG